MLRFTKPLIKVMLYSIIFCGLLFSISLAQTYTGHGVILDETTGLPLPTAAVTGGNVHCVLSDGSGGWFIGGSFTTVGGQPRNGLAHILADGSLDMGWVANITGSSVNAMANASGTGLFVGGSFTAINGTVRNNIAKLSLADGSVQSWNPSGTIDGVVFAIANRNNNAVVGGFFTYGGFSNLIDINSTASFVTPMGDPNNTVWALQIMPAGANAYLYVGGDFTQIFGTPANRIKRIYRDFEIGWYDPGGWYPTGGADGRVRTLTLAGAGSPWEFSVIAGGDFTTIGGVPRNRLAAISFFDASVETWNPDITGSSVYAVASTGPLVYAGGDFSHVGTTPRNNLSAVSTSTGLATTWDPFPNNIVRALALGSVFAGGNFDAMGAPAPEFSVSPSNLDFGTVTVGNFSTLSLTVHNTGSAQLNITNVTSSNSVYTVTPTSGSIAPSDSMSFDVTFTPTSHGTQTGDITFTHNATGSPTDVPVTGFGKSQGGDLVFDPQTRTIFDNAEGYESTVRLQNYVGTDLSALQFKVVLDGGLIFRSIERGSAVPTPAWNFTYTIAEGDYNVDGSRNDTIKVFILGNGSIQLPPGLDYEMAILKYDAVNIQDSSSTTTVHFEKVVGGTGTPNYGEDAFVIAGSAQEINIINRVLWGDVNFDDRVDILDLLLMIDYILDEVPFTPAQFVRGDVAPWSVGAPAPTGDGEINAIDVALLKNVILTGQYPSGEPANITVRNPNIVEGIAKLNPGEDAALTFYINDLGISVTLESIVKVKGLQVEFRNVTSSTSGMNVETALGNGYYHQSEEIVRVLVFEEQGSTINPGIYQFLNMPFNIARPEDIKVVDVILANENNEKIEKVSIYVIYSQAPDMLPTEYSLSQNYPNPFNPTTTVEFSVPRTDNVVIKVYDMLGQEVRTLFTGQVDAGTYRIGWDGLSNSGVQMSSGSYVYRMTAGDFMQSKKMVLLK